MLNNITIMGRMTADPELRRTNSGVPVASFTLAVDRDFKNGNGEKETDFIECVAWKNTAEFVSKYFGKGRMAVVSGRLQIRSWNDKDGNKRRTAEIVADNVYFGDSKNDNGNQNSGYVGFVQPDNGYQNNGNAPAPDFAVIDDDDAQLPF
jgi:single-strand DNA-binding protein